MAFDVDREGQAPVNPSILLATSHRKTPPRRRGLSECLLSTHSGVQTQFYHGLRYNSPIMSESAAGVFKSGRFGRSALVRAGNALIVVLALAILMAAIITLRAAHRPGAPDFPAVLMWQAVIWLPWAAGALLVPFLASRYSFAACRLPVWLGIHVFLSLLFATAHTIWFVGVSDYFSPYRFVAGTKFGVFAYFFIFWFLLDLVIYWGLLGFAYGRDYYSRFLDQSRLVTELETVLLETDADSGASQIDGFIEYIAVRHGTKREIVDAGQVNWIEAQGYYAALHVGAKTYLVRKSLTDLATQLDPKRFIRIHRSTITNVEFIRSIDSAVAGGWSATLADGTKRRVSRSGKRLLETRIPTFS